MLATCYLTCGKIAPDFEQLELSVGESTVAAAVVETTGKLQTSSSCACGHNCQLTAKSTSLVLTCMQLLSSMTMAPLHACNCELRAIASKAS